MTTVAVGSGYRLSRDGKHNVKDATGTIIGTYWEQKDRRYYTSCAGHPNPSERCWWESGTTSLDLAASDLVSHWQEKHEPYLAYAPGQLWLKDDGEAVRVCWVGTGGVYLSVFSLDGGAGSCSLEDIAGARLVWPAPDGGAA